MKSKKKIKKNNHHLHKNFDDDRLTTESGEPSRSLSKSSLNIPSNYTTDKKKAVNPIFESNFKRVKDLQNDIELSKKMLQSSKYEDENLLRDFEHVNTFSYYYYYHF